MPIVVKDSSGSVPLSVVEFDSEQELENLIAEHPELLADDGDADEAQAPALFFVAKQLRLPGAGKLDLLFVTNDGLLVVVEVKLAKNNEARREVVAQAIDYVSALTSLTIDELDERVNGRLRDALQKTAGVDLDSLWRRASAKLRDRKVRLVVALDDAEPGLERMFWFLEGSSRLDVQLLTVQKYKRDGGAIYVSRTRVESTSNEASREGSPKKDPLPELEAVFKAYNAIAPEDIRAWGTAINYRVISIPGWPRHLKYQFAESSNQIFLELLVPTIKPADLPGLLETYEGSTLAQGQTTVVWNQDYNWKFGKGRLVATLALKTDPQIAARALQELISLTREKVQATLNKSSTAQGLLS